MGGYIYYFRWLRNDQGYHRSALHMKDKLSGVCMYVCMYICVALSGISGRHFCVTLIYRIYSPHLYSLTHSLTLLLPLDAKLLIYILCQLDSTLGNSTRIRHLRFLKPLSPFRVKESVQESRQENHLVQTDIFLWVFKVSDKIIMLLISPNLPKSR